MDHPCGNEKVDDFQLHEVFATHTRLTRIRQRATFANTTSDR